MRITGAPPVHFRQTEEDKTLNTRKIPTLSPNEKEPAPRRRRSRMGAQIAAPLLGALSVLLAGALGIALLRMLYIDHQSKEKQAEAEASIAQLEAQLQTTLDTTIPIEDFKNEAARYNLSAEFIQLFFDDVIVYKDEGIVYEPIREDWPKNSYDWSLLDREDGRMVYGDSSMVGIDVAKFQGEIDWAKVAADGIDYAMIRLGFRGYGTGAIVTDPYYEANIDGALENGLDVGVYFFSQATTEAEAVEEAEYVLTQLGDRTITMPVVFDMEMVTEDPNARANGLTPEERTAITRAFCERIAEAGLQPMIYGNPTWLLSKIKLEQLQDYPVWLAQYYREPFYPYPFQMWQYSTTGQVDGISGNVDLNVCFSTDW